MTTRKPKSAPAERVLLLRTCNADGTSYNGFCWPESGPVECPDWNSEPVCGGGLHGLLWGQGRGDLLNWDADARWQVVAADAADVVAIDGGEKVKVPRGEVVFSGDRLGATEYIIANGARGLAVVGAMVTAGYRGTATAGYMGTATAGYRGTATAGYMGTATAGYGGTATAGDGGTATAGYGGTATAGDGGTATAGDEGTATAGDEGTATAGYGGTATAGDGGTATAGDGGTATAGDGGTATAGDKGTIAVRWYDFAARRYCIVSADVGENGILPNVAYRVEVVDGVARLVRADGAE